MARAGSRIVFAWTVPGTESAIRVSAIRLLADD
jgi:hypothetical protein